MEADWLAESFKKQQQTSVLHEWPQSRDSFHLGGVSRYLRTDSGLEDVPFPENHSNHCNHPTLPSRAPFPPPKLLSWEVTCLFLFLHSTAETKPELKKKKSSWIFKEYFIKVSKNQYHRIRNGRVASSSHSQHYGGLDILKNSLQTHSLDNMQSALFYVHGWSLKKVREISNICQ